MTIRDLARRCTLAALRLRIAIAAVCLLAAWPAIAGAGPGAPMGLPSVRRFALVVSANDGGPDRVRLRFADRDAHEMSKVLNEIGGVASEDHIELTDPDPTALDAAFDDIARRIRAARKAGVRIQFVFYYSGHSDEDGLLLAGDRVRYPDLKTRVQGVPADVRIAILDSCASGAFTRLKGGTKRAPFLVGSAAQVEGHAFLTSSSATEAAQESERVGGSFFTHFLTTGLRGAADIDGDRIVTLGEAYQFAFDETLARTQATRGGPQHAAYDIELAGSGDLVMTDLRRTAARLALESDVGGRIFVRRADGQLAAELYKAAGGGTVTLALEAGRYEVTVDDGKALRRADVTVSEGEPATLSAAAFVEVTRESTVARGSEPPGEDDLSRYHDVPFDVGLVPSVSVNAQAPKGKPIRNRVSGSVLWARPARVDGIAISLGAVIVDEHMHGVQAAMLANVSHGRLRGLQASFGYNDADDVSGVQAGIVDHAETIRSGAQFGIVNVAGSVRGVQFGVVNWARQADASIGLIAATKEHGVRPELWTSDAAAFNLGVRVGAKYTYSYASMGVHPFGRGKGWLFGAGLGVHIPIARKFFLDLDLSGHAVLQGLVVREPPGGLTSVRVMFGWQALPRLAVFLGPTVRTLVTQTEDELARGGYGYVAYRTATTDGLDVRVWPGFVAGLRF